MKVTFRRTRPRARRVPLRRGPGVLGLAALLATSGRLAAQSEAPPPVRPSRPAITNDAETHRPGVLQVEVGYSAYGRSDEFKRLQTAPVLLRYAFSERFLAHAAVDAVEREVDPDGQRATGAGDLRLLGQGVLVTGAERHPAVALAYDVKLPTASTRQGLGTGKVDHRLVLLVSRELSGTSVAVNAAYLNNGRPDGPGRTAGGQWTFAVAREPERRGWGTQWEVATETLEAGEPRGTFALGAATYHTSDWVRLDVGVRAGLTPGSPRTNVFAGLTTGVALRGR